MYSSFDINSKRTALDPNAKEFVPNSFQSASVDIKQEVLQSSSSERCKDLPNESLSDEESRRYWDSQLPDDILTPDLVAPIFEDRMDTSISGVSSELKYDQMQLAIDSPHIYPDAEHSNDWWVNRRSLSLHHMPHSGGMWSSPVPQDETGRELMESRPVFNRHGELGSSGPCVHDFPAVAARPGANLYGDFHDEMLSRLKLREDGASWGNAWPSPNFHPSMLPLHEDGINEMFPRHDFVAYQEHELAASLGMGNLQRRNTAGKFSLGPPRFSSQGLSSYEERLRFFPFGVFSRNILESGDVDGAGFHLDRRKFQNLMQAQDSYFEKDHLSVNRNHGKDASVKSNRLAKTVYKRGGDIIPQQSSGQPRLVNLHGLQNVNEAIMLLRQECSAARTSARSSMQRQQIFIFVGSGWPKNARTPRSSKLPLVLAVQHYLLEDEHLTFTEPQPGVIKVVL